MRTQSRVYSTRMWSQAKKVGSSLVTIWNWQSSSWVCLIQLAHTPCFTFMRPWQELDSSIQLCSCLPPKLLPCLLSALAKLKKPSLMRWWREPRIDQWHNSASVRSKLASLEQVWQWARSWPTMHLCPWLGWSQMQCGSPIWPFTYLWSKSQSTILSWEPSSAPCLHSLEHLHT